MRRIRFVNPFARTLISGGFDWKEVVILFRGPGQEYLEAKMELQYGDLYRGTIPAARMVPPGIEYFVEGRTRTGERVPLFMTQKKPARVIILSAEDDFDEAAPAKKGAHTEPARAEPSRSEPPPRRPRTHQIGPNDG